MADFNTKQLRNLALLGHGGSGKTSLAEAMLYIAGATDRLGSIAVGKDADLLVFGEDPLTLAAKPEMVFINGRKVDNLYAIGSVIGGSNSLYEGCGGGVAIVTALAAADRILEKK